MAKRNRAMAGLAAALCLVLAACGSRLDHESIVVAAAGGGTAPGESAQGQGEVGMPGDVSGGTAESRAGSTSAGPSSGTAESGAGTSATGSGPSGSGGTNGTNGTKEGKGGGSSGGPPLVIGTLGTFSGGSAETLAPAARAVQAWAAHVNGAGGVNGRQVKVVVMDDGGQPSKAKSQMQDLVENHKVVAVVAAMTTPSTMQAWKGYVEQRQVPVIGGLCAPEWDQPSPVLFRQCPPNDQQIFGTAKLGAQHGKGNGLGLLSCTEADSCTGPQRELVDNGAAKRAGLEVRYNAKISLFSSDYTSECLQARNNRVDLMWVVGDPGTVSRVAASCNRQNYHPQFLQMSATVGADTVSKTGLGNMLLGMPVFPFVGISTPAYQEFAATWKRYAGGKGPSPSAALGWTSAKLFEKAVKSSRGDISRASLIKALRGMKGERLGGLTAPMTFGPKGTVDVNCTFFMRGSGGKWTAPNRDKPICW